MKLVICEKPSVGAAVAAALGVREKKDGYIEGNGYVISWCIGHLVGLAEAAVYGEQYRKCLPFHRRSQTRTQVFFHQSLRDFGYSQGLCSAFL